jgi:3-hydroxyacyl-CoA dehydrogenase/enoyl-CoA hydratase/3-hydroxybutyryl-CoA epimerase
MLEREVEPVLAPHAVYASNTSTIPIARIAQASARPDRVLGMHFFSPVHKMPLLEVIVTPRTSDDVTATAVAYGKKLGKTVIVVNDGPGFYANRILSPYVNEAGKLLDEGAATRSGSTSRRSRETSSPTRSASGWCRRSRCSA